MKNLIWGTILTLALAASTAFGTELTVSSEQLQNWRFGGSTARLRIVANRQFLTSDNKIIMQGNLAAGAWYKDITCTVSGSVLTIPQFTLDSTTDSSYPTATYSAQFFDSTGRTRLSTYLLDFKVPHTLGTTLSWTQILTYNNGRAVPPLATEYYTSEQVNSLIAGLTTIQEVADMIADRVDPVTDDQTANKVFASPDGSTGAPAWRALVAADIPSLDAAKITSGTLSVSLIPSLDVSKITTGTFADSFIPPLAASKITSGTFNTARLGAGTPSSSTYLRGDGAWVAGNEKDLSADYSNSMTTLAAESAETFVNCSAAVTVSSNVTLPKNVKFRPTKGCAVTVLSGITLTIGTFVNPGNVKVFTTTGTGKVLFSKGAVDEINLAWWVGNTSGANVTDALSEALESANASAGKIYIPAGQWYSSGEHSISTGVYIRGAGNSPSYGMPNSTTLTLQSPTGTHLLKVGEAVYSTRISDIILDGTGTTGKTGFLFEGTGGALTTSADWRADNVTFQNFSIGLNVNSLGSSWQTAQMMCVQCIFQNNTTGVRFSSVNHQWVALNTNFAIGANGVAYDIVAAGAFLQSGGEFAGALSSANFTDADVNTGTDTITVTGHPFSNGDTVFLYSSGVLPTGSPAIQRRLKIRNATANTVQLEKEDGTDIDITSAAGGGTHTIYRPTSKVMTISGSHGAINFESVQDEGNLTFLQNDASDISGIINIYGGSLIQSKIQLNQSCKVNIRDSNVMAHAVQGTSGGGAVVSVSNSHFRQISVDDGYTPSTQFNDSDARIVKEELTDLSVFKQRVPQQFISPLSALGAPSTPVLTLGHITGGTDENKVLLRLGRMDTAGVFDFYYDIYRDHSDGKLNFAGNQSDPFKGFVFNAPVETTGITIGSGSYVSKILKGTVTLDPAPVNGTTFSSQTFTLTGAAVGDALTLNPPTAGITSGIIIASVYVSASDEITVNFYNTTGAPIDLASAAWTYSIIR